jgi:hypothetical protein
MVISVRAEVSRLTALHATRRIVFGLQVMWWPLCLLTFLAVVLQFGVWRKEIDVVGPFAPATNPPQHALVVAVPSEGAVPWWRQPLIGDSAEKPLESKLRLRIAGREIWPAHSDPASIREGKATGYSHRGSDIVFSLPPGVKNAPETVVTLWYKIRPRLWVTLALMLPTLALGLLLYFEALRSLALGFYNRIARASGDARPWMRLLSMAPYVLLFGLSVLCLTGTIGFLGFSLYAWTAGWALPTTAPIRWFSWTEWTARNEPYFGYLLLALSGFGIVTTWFSVLTRHHETTAVCEARLRAFLKWSGFPIAATAFLLGLSAIWDGIARPGDPHWANIGGLIPFNDAHGHIAEAFFEAKQGVWTPWALRRPLAAAFRSVLLFASDFSFPVMLTLQAFMLALAVCISSYAVMIWRGIWAGLCFFGFAYIYTRIFMPTSLTEPLGLFWSLLSVPFFIASFRSGSVKPGLVGFAMTSMALMTRMGSMFTIPALLLWLVWQFGRSSSDKVKIGVVAIGILFSVIGVNSLLAKAYGTGSAETGSNFSYTLCGLSIGTTWDGCPAKLAQQGEPVTGDEATVAKRLYAFAWQNFKSNPAVFFERLAGGAKEFLTSFPTVVWKGYGAAVDVPIWLSQSCLVAICFVGLCYIAVYGMNRIEVSFWVLLWASIIASSAMIYYDDGARVLAASHPLIVLFIAMGMSNPEAGGKVEARRQFDLYGASGLIVAAILFVSVPWIAHRVLSGENYPTRGLQSRQSEVSVFGRQLMSGFLVVGDGSALRTDVPTLHFSDFEKLVAQSGVELYQGLLHPIPPPMPFGFVFAAPIDEGMIGPNIFIVPAQVMEGRDVPAWRLEFQPWSHKNDAQGQYWFLVTKAEPWRRP